MWQSSLFEANTKLGRAAGADTIRSKSAAFAAAYRERKAKSQDYGKLLSGLMPSLRRVAKVVALPDGDRLLAGMDAKLNDPALLQGAHRNLLLALAKLQ